MDSFIIVGGSLLGFAIVSYIVISILFNVFFNEKNIHKILETKTIHFPVVGLREREKVVNLLDSTLLVKVSYKRSEKIINVYIKDITRDIETEILEIKSGFDESSEFMSILEGKTSDGNIKAHLVKLNKSKIELDITIINTTKIPFIKK